MSESFLKRTSWAVEMTDNLPKGNTDALQNRQKSHSRHGPELHKVNGRRAQHPVNEARAMRVAEVMNDYRTIQRRIAQIQVVAPQHDYYEEGYQILRQCQAEAQAVLAAPYENELLQPPRGPGEAEKRQLQRIILDASARRSQAQRIYLRAMAAVRWVNVRNAILRGQEPFNGNIAAVQQVDINLRTELAAITDQSILNEFRRVDTLAGHYLSEDPSLAAILGWIQSH